MARKYAPKPHRVEVHHIHDIKVPGDKTIGRLVYYTAFYRGGGYDEYATLHRLVHIKTELLPINQPLFTTIDAETPERVEQLVKALVSMIVRKTYPIVKLGQIIYKMLEYRKYRSVDIVITDKGRYAEIQIYKLPGGPYTISFSYYP